MKLFIYLAIFCSLIIGCSKEDEVKELTQEELQQMHRLQIRRAVQAEQESLRSQGFRVDENNTRALTQEELQQLHQLEQQSQQNRQRPRTTVIDTGKPVGY